ncbi:hypothetical protein EHQ58_14290 [Leptospira ognonensis]|uniref:Peptidylprolyl isomerase n=1 Tax=Leptospira ognonensis TaxID=2484945 RepID=A0A4R9K0A4_9LEPT|nr:hypothetical protein [Leptospira ognonensis]TGL57449.1 hypothetical protein EHQ58_14290 [Leptospira ognonensis]
MNRKKLAYVSIALTIGFFSSNNCSGDSEILATFDGGTVSRGELNFVIEASKRGNGEPQTIAPDVQVKIIEGVALEKILLKDSIQSKKVDPNDLVKIENLVSDFLKLNIYLREYMKKAMKQKPLEFVDLQIAIIRGEDGASNEKKADELLAKLSNASRSEINTLISENTDDVGRKPIAGKLEPFCVNCSSNPLEDIIEEAKKDKAGKFVKFSKDPRMIYIVRITNTEKVNPSRVAKYYTEVFNKFGSEAKEYGITHTDEQSKNAIAYYAEGSSEEKGKQFAGQMLKQFEQGLYQNELNRLKEESGIVVNPMKPVYGPEQVNPKEYTADLVLFTNKDKSTYTWKDLEVDFTLVPATLKQEYKDEKAKIFDMINLFQSTILQGKIAKNLTVVQKLESNTAFRMQLDKMRVSLALKALQDEIKAVPVNVTEQQMKDTYEAGKLYAYSSEDPKNPNNRIPQSYGQVRERIKTELEGTQRNTFIEQKISGLKSSYNLKIDPSRLKEVTL